MEKNEELQSLLDLLDDTDPTIYQNVKEGILNLGYLVAGDALLKLETSSENVLVKNRCNYLYAKLRSLHFSSELKTWAFINDGYNWDFIYILSEFCNSAFDRQKALDTLKQYEEEFFSDFQELKAPEENAKMLQELIYKKFAFTFSYQPLDFSALLLGSFYETKKGSPFLFCMLYCMLAEKRRLPIFTVAFPANLVLVYAKKELPATEEDILFYINPANGEVFSKNGIDLFLKRYNLENKIQYFLPCSTSEIAVLYLYTLKEAYLSVGQEKRASEMNRFAEIILETIKQQSNNNPE